MRHKIKTTLMATMFAGGMIFNQSCGQVGTSEVEEKTAIATNNLVTQQSVWITEKKAVQGDKNTNGWSCVLSVGNQYGDVGQQPPLCQVSINNVSTDEPRYWVGLYWETYSKIELLNEEGESVAKTAHGKQIGTRASNGQIKEMVKNRFQELNQGRVRADGFVPVRLGQTIGFGFSIPDLFELEESGEYTLKVQTCLIQRMGGEKYDPELKITWLPEVSAKIQIHAGNPPK